MRLPVLWINCGLEFCNGAQDLPKTRNESEVKVEHVLEPLNSGGGLVGQDLDEVRTGFVTGRLEGILVELLDAVTDLVVNLCAGQGTVDTRGGLGGVSSEET